MESSHLRLLSMAQKRRVLSSYLRKTHRCQSISVGKIRNSSSTAVDSLKRYRAFCNSKPEVALVIISPFCLERKKGELTGFAVLKRFRQALVALQKFGFINGVDDVNWPPYRDSKS